MIGALSFVLIADTVHAFTGLSNHVGDQEQVILDYFDTYYMGELRRSHRLNPRYPHTFWNVNVRVQDHLPPTNNHLEGWHNRFAQIVEQPHPHIWKFIGTLKKDCAINLHLMMREIIGADAPQQKRL